ncbi:hypothetical protein WISP_112563 [Willisornis vidua]|uniref:Uncharacterized protein n=1 Tax=Willisornis vidua TaxID=1566151 RepID=A0ABQ9D0Y3_9PASS|nr:hypothetical protein WISP_112563 [Willisornis vidua]
MLQSGSAALDAVGTAVGGWLWAQAGEQVMQVQGTRHWPKESEFLCLEFDEAKVSQMLKKLSEIEESMTLLTQTT